MAFLDYPQHHRADGLELGEASLDLDQHGLVDGHHVLVAGVGRDRGLNLRDRRLEERGHEQQARRARTDFRQVEDGRVQREARDDGGAARTPARVALGEAAERVLRGLGERGAGGDRGRDEGEGEHV